MYPLPAVILFYFSDTSCKVHSSGFEVYSAEPVTLVSLPVGRMGRWSDHHTRLVLNSPCLAQSYGGSIYA